MVFPTQHQNTQILHLQGTFFELSVLRGRERDLSQAMMPKQRGVERMGVAPLTPGKMVKFFLS